MKAYRKEHHMSMDDFAKVSGMSKTYVWMLEKNINSKTGKKIVPSLFFIL
ncbi:helix-turn-helix domain-containing protein [Oribacterium sp. FC2011]